MVIIELGLTVYLFGVSIAMNISSIVRPASVRVVALC